MGIRKRDGIAQKYTVGKILVVKGKQNDTMFSRSTQDVGDTDNISQYRQRLG